MRDDPRRAPAIVVVSGTAGHECLNEIAAKRRWQIDGAKGITPESAIPVSRLLRVSRAGSKSSDATTWVVTCLLVSFFVLFRSPLAHFFKFGFIVRAMYRWVSTCSGGTNGVVVVTATDRLFFDR